MTDPIMVEELATDAEPAAVYKTYLANIEEALEHARAADTLGLGFRLESYVVSSGEDSASGEFEFTLLSDMPSRAESDD